MEEEIKTTSQDQQEAQPQEGQGEKGTAGEEEQVSVGAAQATETVEVLGRKYNLSDPNQVRILMQDYDRLGRVYTQTAQKLAELERIVQENQQSQEGMNVDDPETRAYLKKLGVVFEDEMRQREEEKMLENTLQTLEAEYDGSDGRPKFDRVKVLDFCLANGIANPEYGYKLMYWNELKEWELRQLSKAPNPPPSQTSSGTQKEPKPKKRVFGLGTENEEEVPLREAMLETLDQFTPKSTI